MSDRFVPTDQQYRDRIETDLSCSFFVEAGAGTGKTFELVKRITNLLSSGQANIGQIAAITFTEAAAAELKDRVRAALEKAAANQKLAEDERQRCWSAASGLDNASIQTLHSFAASLLREKPIEAGLPPNFKVVDEIKAGVDFEQGWQSWLENAMEEEETAGRLKKALAVGIKLDYLKSAARAFNDNYDLLPERFEPVAPVEPRAVRLIVASRDRIRGLIRLAKNGNGDPLAAHARKVLGVADALSARDPASAGALMVLAGCGKLSCGSGNQAGWNADPATGINGCKCLKDLLKELEAARGGELGAVGVAALVPLLESLSGFVHDQAERRRESGSAQFHDLLVWARNLLRDNRDARGHFQKRFSHFLIDEFQDTDPIQAEIAFFLAADREAMGDAATTETDWKKLKIAPGKLFVVGDPKQSIYRFRRADIATVQSVARRLGADNLPLCQNFRSRAPVIDWVNAIFGRWMGAGIEDLQAAYSSLSTRWDRRGEPPPGAHWFGGPGAGNADEIRKEETAAIVNILRRIRTSDLQVRADDRGNLRTAGFADICILMPTRTILPELERALDDAGLPYRIESESFVLGTQDVRELLSCLRAIDSPADRVALVAALRSTAFGCSDVELVEFLDRGGRLDYTDPGAGGGHVHEALQTLARYNRERTWMPMDKLIDRFIRETRLKEIAFARRRPRERLRRLELVVEEARAFFNVGGNSLRLFADWIEQQAKEGARMVEIPVPEADEDAVRVMTIHAAKGLEFPVVILAGIGTARSPMHDMVIFDRKCGKVHVRVGPKNTALATLGYDEAEKIEKNATEQETIRLMYVAATRAKDHLFVSLFRKGDKKGDKVPAADIEMLAEETNCAWDEWDISPPAELPVTENAPADRMAPDTKEDRARWVNERAAVIQRASRKPSVAVTEIVQSLKEESEDGDVYYRKGRGGSNLGRAVHSVLQTVDLATGEGLEKISQAQAAGEGIAERWAEVARLAQNALDSPVVRRAVASGRYYREVFVAAPITDGLMEGYIDLLFEEDGGMVVADYKTDALDNEEEEMKKLDRYGLQAGAYALAISKATGKPVKEVVLVFLSANKEICLTDVGKWEAVAHEKAKAVLG